MKSLIYTYNHGINNVELKFYSDGTLECSCHDSSKFWEIRNGNQLWHKVSDRSEWTMYTVPLDECFRYGGLLRAYISHELEKAMLT